LLIICRQGDSLGWNHWRPASAHLCHDRLAVTDERHVGRLVVTDLLECDVELDDLHILGIARCLVEVKDPVEPCIHQEHDGFIDREMTEVAAQPAGPGARPGS
jgi:hypothetical protein